MAVEDQLREIRTRISQVQSQKARATVEHENAVARRDAAKKTLKEEFGVETTEDAKRVLAELQTELNDAVAAVESKLSEAGA